jgi:CBS domain-containing protein
MQVRDIMTHNPEVTHPATLLRDVAQQMKAHDIGVVLICDGDRLVGMLTDRDIATRAVAEGHDPTKLTVRDVMTVTIVYCFEDQDVQEAARLMEAQQIRRLPVLNRKKRLVGIVSLEDLAAGSGDPRLAGETLKGVSKLAGPQR